MNSSSVDISILMPVYNVGDYLEASINSILNQMNKESELIIVNDASTDNSITVLEKYNHIPNIQIIHSEVNHGIASTRNILLSYATKSYVWFVDSDDLLCKDAFEKVAGVLSRTCVDILIGDYLIYGQDGSEEYKKGLLIEKDFIYDNSNLFLLKSIIKSNDYLWNKIFKRDIANRVLFKQGYIFEDIFYMTDLSSHCKNFTYMSIPLIKYRQHSKSLVSNRKAINYYEQYIDAILFRINRIIGFLNEISDSSISESIYCVYGKYINIMKEIYEIDKEYFYILNDKYDLQFNNALLNITNVNLILKLKFKLKKRKLQKYYNKCLSN